MTAAPPARTSVVSPLTMNALPLKPNFQRSAIGVRLTRDADGVLGMLLIIKFSLALHPHNKPTMMMTGKRAPSVPE